ncbi:MAG: response regulator [Hyphomicrobiales bacterium]|nr:response regulator [Hyphomicrobiales bacterium]
MSRLDRVRAEQIAALYASTPVGVVGALVGGCLLAFVLLYSERVGPTVAGIWVACLAADVVAHLWLCRAYWRRQPLAAAWRTWAILFCSMSFAEGATWGIGSVALISAEHMDQQLWVMLVAASVASGAAAAFGSYLPAFYALLFPAMTPYMVWTLLQGGMLHHTMTLMTLLFIVAFALVGWRANRILVEALTLRFENLDLIDSVRQEKERAEQANIDKSRFLASASHDLRQPVHALSMFVGALRGRDMDAEARRLTEQIDGSVTALDSLFSSLLDISRLDAGVVQSHPQGFAIAPMLERICRDYEEEAVRKGVRLVARPCALSVHTDPILLERVLRNLVSNAVRYTDRGRVVVGCRRGARLRIQVCDTGKGIPPDEQERVFQEFYQIENPERDRSKGLGLGLAIVRRLTALLGCPLDVRSRLGKGSIFTVTVPIATGARQTSAVPLVAATAAAGGLILVIDDERAIQEAMRSLLAGWGHEVIAAGSCAEMLDRIATCPDVPRLIICDYRLRGGENGIATIRRLQSEYNEDIPAMLITGDTAPDRLQEARESGFLLLHKPVPNSKLRASIGNLVQAARGETGERPTFSEQIG